jgi:hypothetical protein
MSDSGPIPDDALHSQYGLAHSNRYSLPVVDEISGEIC